MTPRGLAIKSAASAARAIRHTRGLHVGDTVTRRAGTIRSHRFRPRADGLCRDFARDQRRHRYRVCGGENVACRLANVSASASARSDWRAVVPRIQNSSPRSTFRRRSTRGAPATGCVTACSTDGARVDNDAGNPLDAARRVGRLRRRPARCRAARRRIVLLPRPPS